MMEDITLYDISYYEKTVFKGSYRGICFRIGKLETGGGDGDDKPTEKKLHVWVWKGPYILEKTSEEVYEEDFDFTQEGLDSANTWIANKQQEIAN